MKSINIKEKSVELVYLHYEDLFECLLVFVCITYVLAVCNGSSFVLKSTND